MYAYCPGNCECNEQGDCISCKNGYYDTSTTCAKQCSVNCLTCESKESCHECKNGFFNGYENNKNINLQLNNCTYACREACTQCQSYNTCLQCIKGKYGSTCQEDCSIGCKDKTCSIDSGQCECINNFTGDTCIKCIHGKYGIYCNKHCPDYCKENSCDKSKGKCINGCTLENITGDTCNMCRVGLYGEHCENSCPVHCKDTLCERFTGKCINGCEGNFNGSFCDTCVNGKYGRTCNCELSCPVECDSGACKTKTDTLGSQDGDGRKEQVTIAVLGSTFALSACANILQAAIIFVLYRKLVSKSDGMRQSLNVVYVNQPVSSDDHSSRTTQEDSNTAPVTRKNVYEVISRSTDAEHDYQQL